MNDASSTQGWTICIGAGVLAALFGIGVLNGSYVALAIPVSVLTLFVLGLAGWVGYTIATVRAEPAVDPTAELTPVESVYSAGAAEPAEPAESDGTSGSPKSGHEPDDDDSAA